MIRIKATPKFMRLAQRVMSPEASQELIDALVLEPENGVLIQATGGIRKIQWRTGMNNKGKSGGIRVLYYYDKSTLIILLITLFNKSTQENIDAAEKAELKKLLPELLRSYCYE